MHPCKFTSVTLPYAKVNTTKTEQYSVYINVLKVDIDVLKVLLESSFHHYVEIVAEDFITY